MNGKIERNNVITQGVLMTVPLTLEEHERLLEDGWQFRFNGDEPRISEMKEFYEDMGLEVLVKVGVLDDGSDCRACLNTEGCSMDRYKTVYTRVARDISDRPDDDLF